MLKRSHVRCSCLVIALLAALAVLPISGYASGPSTDSWQVYGSVDVDNMTRGANRLSNAGFESGSTGWTGYGSRYTIDLSQSHSGGASARIDGGSLGAALQGVTLNQSHAKPIYVSGWSKSINAPGGGKMNYSLYFDIVYTDGTVPYSPYYAFTGGTHGWEQVDEIIYPEKPIKTLHLWCMFNSTGGQAWFDDLAVGEFTGEIRHFDDQQVLYAAPGDQPWSGSSTVQVSTGDGLALTMSAHGAMPTSLTVDGQQQLSGALYTGGFFVRDVAAGSGYVHLGGLAEQQGGNVRFSGRDAALGLALDATFYSLGDRILIDASLRDTSGADRAVSLYYALPIAPDGRTWWQDIRTGVPADSLTEHRFALETEWGVNGYMSHYCLSSLSGPSGLAMAYPMDRPVVSRFSYNSATRQYYFVADLGLAAETQPNSRQADVQFMLYAHDPDWGFRAAFDKYVDIYPQFFEDRCEEDGVWVAHAELDGIPNIDDFNIQFHETGNSRVYAADDALGVYTLRYLIEPWAYWLNAPSSVDTRDYDQVMAHVNTMLSSPVLNERRWGQAILSSGIHDANGRIRYEPLSEAFMTHAASFVLDGNPKLDVPGYDYTKGTQSWSDNTMDVYNHPEWGLLDGEYIDSFESRGTYSDFAKTHFGASSHPLTFDMATSRPVLPEIFSSYELAKTISENIHSIDKLVMANSTLLRWAFPAHLFDIMGSERGWVHNGRFLPDMDNLLNMWRTFSYHKPYAVLQNGDLTSMDHAMVERYFQHAAFYGIYPSFFTYDGGVHNYWSTPEWYERDRDLHQKYIPIIKTINAAGWEPVSAATADNGHIYVERYGDGESFYIALLNKVEYPQNTTVSIDLHELGLPAIEGYDMSEVITGESVAYQVQGQGLAIPMTLPANTTRILRVTFTNAETQEVPLIAGWNLVSLPGEPYSGNAATLFASLGGAMERAYGWDAASQSWLRYDPDHSFANTLHNLSAGQGLWLNVNQDTTWRVGCLAQHAHDVPLVAGWNLVGSPLNRSISAGQVLATLGSAYDVAYAYQAEADMWDVYARDAVSGNTLDAIEPGRGYWVLANQATIWTLSDGSAPPPTATPRPTNTPKPSPTPTQTLTPSITPTASNTPLYTATPYPTATPTAPVGPAPTNTPVPSGQGESMPLLGDNYINQWAPSNNNGSYYRLMVRQGDIYASLIQFDTSGIPQGTRIQAATLRVWAEHRTNAGSLDVTVYPITRPWDEMSSSWYQATSGHDWEAAGCNGASDRTADPVGGVTFNNVGVWFNIDITDAVQAWVDGSMENNGLVLKGSGSVSVSYELSSRNDSSSYKHPRLDVIY